MGLFSFLKRAGSGAMKSEAKRSSAAKTKKSKVKRNQAEILQAYLSSLNLPIQGLHIDLNGSTVIVYGKTKSQEAKEKAILALGNMQGIKAVDDRIVLKAKEKKVVFHTVKKGDSLSKIAKKYYGDPLKYMEIFKANVPLLNDPNLIYPGQVLRIPKRK